MQELQLLLCLRQIQRSAYQWVPRGIMENTARKKKGEERTRQSKPKRERKLILEEDHGKRINSLVSIGRLRVTSGSFITCLKKKKKRKKKQPDNKKIPEPQHVPQTTWATGSTNQMLMRSVWRNRRRTVDRRCKKSMHRCGISLKYKSFFSRKDARQFAITGLTKTENKALLYSIF